MPVAREVSLILILHITFNREGEGGGVVMLIGPDTAFVRFKQREVRSKRL